MKNTLVAILCSVALAGALACGEEKAGGADDNAEEPGEGSAPKTTHAPADKGPGKTGDKAKDKPKPEDMYEGVTRFINLAMKDGKPIAIDVWATRSFKFDPIKLAENIEFGASTEWITGPQGSPIKAFIAGASSDDKDAIVSGTFGPKKGEHVTTIVYNDKGGKFTSGSWWDTSDDAEKSQTPDAPPAGKGFVIFRAGQLRPHEDAMKDVTGGWALRVGDGKGKCLPQRVEELGFQAALLGGTQPVQVDLDPGKQKVTFHKGMAKGCEDATKVYEAEIDVKADAAHLVLLFTRDAKSVEHAVYDMPVNKAKPFGTNKKLKEKKDADRAAKKAAEEKK